MAAMKENELIFDRTKHVCYSEAVKKVITDQLKKKFSEEKADILWEKIQLKYIEYLQTLPYLGGVKDNHNAPGGTYDCKARSEKTPRLSCHGTFTCRSDPHYDLCKWKCV